MRLVPCQLTPLQTTSSACVANPVQPYPVRESPIPPVRSSAPRAVHVLVQPRYKSASTHQLETHVSSPRSTGRARHRLVHNLYIRAPPPAACLADPTIYSFFLLPFFILSSLRATIHKSIEIHTKIQLIIKNNKSSMAVGMKREREREQVQVSLALSLTTTDSTASTTASADSAGAVTQKKRARRGRVVATSGEGEFVCKTCARAFTSFQALGGHRTSHLRGRHGLELGVGVAKAIREHKRRDENQHECHLCGLVFETGQALGGHMRRHREEMALGGAGAHDQGNWRSVLLRTDRELAVDAADRPPVLLELFV
ncbi:hypothetical protein QYE76_060668 [Lolium multiflorum]|uniref:C2H2-type domain-containing protein n=1 Tax=Lolium multiflorum TaxID=4521 RepID=A0AAD8S0U9_LOLMU|nr:hypothetical protein QYE76_060668 [Lolium multiflorum]